MDRIYAKTVTVYPIKPSSLVYLRSRVLGPTQAFLTRQSRARQLSCSRIGTSECQVAREHMEANQKPVRVR
jgi:hypothetical protein